jgi:isopenicillin-N epimerase
MRTIRRQYIEVVRSFSTRKSFGSFHSDDIEELVRIDPFPAPSIYNEIHAQTQHQLQRNLGRVRLGKDIKQKLFVVDDSWTFLNHGAFGGTLRPILEEAHQWRMQVESQPLKFFDRDLFALECHSLHSIAKLMNTSPLQLLPIANVTTGLNAIFETLQHLPPTEATEIAYLSLTYGSTKKIIHDFVARTNESHHHTYKMIPLQLPIHSNDHLIQQITSHVHKGTKVIILDHITSNTALELPILEIAKVCKTINKNIIVVIDAAHSLFSQPPSFLPSSAAAIPTTSSNNSECLSQYIDYWIGNGHKWLSACKGSAVLWKAPHCLQLRPTIISHGYIAEKASASNTYQHKFAQTDKVLSSFAWDGCRDYIPFITIPSTINLWNHVVSAVDNRSHDTKRAASADSWEVFRQYTTNLLEDAENLFRKDWQLSEESFISHVSLRERVPMRLIPLPTKSLFPTHSKDHVYSDKEAFHLQELLHHDHRIEVPIKCIEGKLYTRISAHVYNEMADYERLNEVIKRIHCI